MVFILIHRKTSYNLEMAMREFLDELYLLNPSYHIKLDRVKRRIEINHGLIIIDFRCGDFYRLDGCTPPYIYNTDSRDASKFLALSASKCNGFEVYDLKDLAEILCGIKVKEDLKYD